MYFKKQIGLLTILIIGLFVQKSWAQIPPIVTATGNQIYCPLSQINIATDFDIIPGDDEIDAVFIQISENYIQGEDTLLLTGLHPTITTSWSTTEGKLTLTALTSSPTAYIDLIAAVKDVLFQSNALTISGEKHFSITVDEANYLPSTGHYYEYVQDIGVTWSDAKISAETSTHYGLQGYLATITSAEEAQLSGEQAIGTGWIGASDATVEGTWRWVTGPEGLENGGLGRQFWLGRGIATGGTTTAPDNFAFWNSIVDEPNQDGNEDYAHIVSPNLVPDDAILGSWNDLSNTGATSGDYQPKGYIVEYGGMSGDPILNISASTKLTVASISSTTNGSNCGAGTVTLSANATLGANVLWFDSLTGGVQLGSGTNFTTPSITSITTYYALASEGGCITGVRTPIVATIYDIPTISSTTDVTICGAGSGTLMASSSAGVINWYTTLTGGVSINTGTTFISPSIVNTTTYYVDATENGCTTLARTPITINVQYTNAPTGLSNQTFCDIENATLNELSIIGTTILWYDSPTGGTSLNNAEILVNNTTYYASQTVNGCESLTRLAIEVIVYETVTPLLPSEIPVFQECDNTSDGDDTNGVSIFDLTLNDAVLLNGKSASDFTINYFTDATYLNQISNSTSFENTIINGQLIYVRMFNNLENNCFTETSFNIQVNPLPVIVPSLIFKNCDEDGIPDGFTDYNLNEANNIITFGDTNLSVTYHLTSTDADNGINSINPSPFNNLNAIANTVYARVENSFGCYKVSTVSLDVSTTTFPPGFNYEIENCDADNIIDGLELFDFTNATQYFLTQLPPQNLSIHYYRNLTDAQLEENEILSQNSYQSETPYLQTLYVRVENDDNGDCFGIGEHLTLTVYPRPEFEVTPTAIACLNLPPVTLTTFNPNGVYNYEWTDENGTIISTLPTASVSSGGIYTVMATSGLNCESFPQTITVSESVIATITIDVITITDDSANNTITINTSNLGFGDYEFALDNAFGTYQDEPYFENVSAGIHTIYVQDKNDCGIAEIEVSVIGFPKFFTPNNDATNDTWQIRGVSSNFFPTSLIYIFDRFGKLITKVDPTGEGWDGYYNGIMLPSADYWFSVQLIDNNGNVRKKKGHFSLIRR